LAFIADRLLEASPEKAAAPRPPSPEQAAIGSLKWFEGSYKKWKLWWVIGKLLFNTISLVI
jgi:hypothetical protein